MIIQIFAIYDSAAEAYNQPFFAQAKGQAIRMFTQSANDPKSNINQYPSDFTLFHIGSFDDATAKMDLHQAPIGLGTAIEFKTSLTTKETLDLPDAPSKMK